jgi:hypothetical protein
LYFFENGRRHIAWGTNARRLLIEDFRRSRLIRETKKKNDIMKARNIENKKNIYYFVISPFRVFVIDLFIKKYPDKKEVSQYEKGNMRLH